MYECLICIQSVSTNFLSKPQNTAPKAVAKTKNARHVYHAAKKSLCRHYRQDQSL